MDYAKEIWEASELDRLEKRYGQIPQYFLKLEAHGFFEAGKYKCLQYLHFTSTYSNNITEKEVLAGFADEVIYSLFTKQSEDWDLLHEDLEQIDDLDIEEMDINWQIAMIAIRMKKECTTKGPPVGKRGEIILSTQRSWGKSKRRSNGLADNGFVGIDNWGENINEDEDKYMPTHGYQFQY
ncbi:hypothetical protein Tco_0428979 [Tanacetum coccineum]